MPAPHTNVKTNPPVQQKEKNVPVREGKENYKGVIYRREEMLVGERTKTGWQQQQQIQTVQNKFTTNEETLGVGRGGSSEG